jgi:hypothetical protein
MDRQTQWQIEGVTNSFMPKTCTWDKNEILLDRFDVEVEF